MVGYAGMPRETTVPAGDRLQRRLGFWSAVALVIGITIGSGIFRTPAVVAGRVPDPFLMLSLWVIGGVMALSGALSFAELAASLPRSGGVYVFLREGWGRLAGFLFGWAELVLIRGVSAAAIASVFGEYLLRTFGVDPIERAGAADLVAAGALVFATAVNVMGVRLGAAIVGLSTAAKYGGLAAIVAAAFLFGADRGASTGHFVQAAGDVTPGLFGLALISVLWAYDGFADLAYVAGEVKDPQRTLPRALAVGTLAIVVIYLLTNAAYLYVIPVDRMAGSQLIAADTMTVLFGGVATTLISALVMVSTFGALIGIMLSGPRIFFAMADDGLLFRPVAAVHPRFGTPHVAIILNGSLGVLMVLMQTFEQLADTFVLATWPFYIFAVAALYRLRRTRPDLPRPYRVTGYPVVPAIFIAAASYLILNALVTDPFWTSVVFGIVLLGVPVYYVRFNPRRIA
jgi:APA family basic amino acid/polyamine antiporter